MTQPGQRRSESLLVRIRLSSVRTRGLSKRDVSDGRHGRVGKTLLMPLGVGRCPEASVRSPASDAAGSGPQAAELI